MISKWRRFSIYVIAIAVSISLAYVRPQAVADDRSALDRLSRDYVEATELIREKYVEEVEYEALTTTAILGMLRTLDPHSNYYDRKSFEEMRMEQRSQYYGIGASIVPRHRGVYIIETFKDTPATGGGLRYGDQIIAIDGKNTETWNSDQVRDNLRGELGTEVKVTVRRAGAAEPITIALDRAAVDLTSISGYYIVKPGVGYIALSRGFHSTTGDELTSAISALKAQGMNSLLLDLRGNPGGLLEQAIRVADMFLQRGQVVLSVRGRGRGRGGDRDWPAESGTPEAFPLVVLIDDGSASASEIVAGAIQDHDRGMIIGEPSFGKGLVQTMFPLYGGAGLTLTTARYYTPSGRLIQRDYSNGSSYEYHFRRSANGSNTARTPHNDMRRTDTGRAVYGGGGIEPDIKVDAPTYTDAQGTLWTTGLFMFVRELMAGRVATAPDFKREAIEFGAEPQPDEFVINDQIMKTFRDFMSDFLKKNQDIKLTMKAVDENFDWARRKIREEALIAAYGLDIQRRMTVEMDTQLQRAIAEIPQSAELAERARKLSRASKK